MNKLMVKYENNEIIVLDDQKRLTSRPVRAADFADFKMWIESYNHAVNQDDNREPLLSIGRKIFTWLDNDQGWLVEYLKNPTCPFLLEFRIPVHASQEQKAFIEVPWEILAAESGHLAKNPDLKFCPVRRIGEQGKAERTPSKYKLNTVFMAASPRNVRPVLAYEQEESAILSLYAEKSLNMDLFVEESGNLAQLTQLINEVKPVDVVHLSCHGNIEFTPEKTAPYLCLETITGELDTVNADAFEKEYSQNRPALIFLSACKTAETYPNKESSPQIEYDTFTQTIIKRGFPAVLGWSGSVSDHEATRFAGEFYRNLSQAATVEDAVAKARFSLFIPPRNGKEPTESKDWHLARLYLGAQGGGILSAGNDERFERGIDTGVKEFLGKKEKGLEVAGRKEFVGRRRQIQAILKEFSDPNYAGVLIHGLGRQGKSSLAARVANRLHTHETVLIYGKKGDERMYSAYHVLNELKSVANLPTEKRIDELLREIEPNETYLKASLKELLEGPFSGKDHERQAILMVVDDLEKILTAPKSAANIYGVNQAHQATLIAVISAFKEAHTKSRLIITSRYDFDLFDNDTKDIAGLLMKLPLTPMNDTEAEKQYLAKYGAVETTKDQITLEPARVVAACKGNPGLQDLMFNLFINVPGSYLKALQEMENYLMGGDLPEEQKVQDFLQDLALDNILNLLTGGEKGLLQAAALFEIPVPGAVFKAIMNKIGISKSVNYEKRLIGFGILEQYEDLVYPGRKSLLLNNITRPRIEALPSELITDFAGIITETLFSIWCADQKSSRPWICDREIVKFGLMANHSRAVVFCAENCIRGMDNEFLTKEAAVFAVYSISLLENTQESVPAGLYQIASDVCHSTGEVEKAQEYIEKALNNTEADLFTSALSYLQLGRILVQKDNMEEANKALEKSKELFLEAKKYRESAIASGYIARIKVSKGEVDEALKLHQEELDVYEKLGDTRSKAVTLGEIARIKVDKGEVDEALKLHQEIIRVFEKLGDTRSKAVILGDIARIKVSKGEVDEALKLHQEELDVYEKLGDTRSKAVTLGYIARIKVDKGEVDEALKLHQEIIRVFEKLGDTRSKAVTLGEIAHIKEAKGEVDEALKLHQEIIRVFEKLGDTRSKAVTLGEIAHIKEAKGEVDEALKLHQERIRVFEKLGDTRSKAVTLGDIASIKVSKGEVDEALKLHQDRIRVFEKLGDTREKAVTLGDIARIKVSKGEVDEALKLHQEELDVYEKLGDLDGRANTLWNMSKILLRKGDFQKAYEFLAESYQINLKLGRLDGICFVGADLGMLLCRADQKEEGLKILERSREGFLKLGQNESSLQIQEIINEFK
jgi:tetratricopeptide (TPR) repeat protein/CHAT domain-containing protein